MSTQLASMPDHSSSTTLDTITHIWTSLGLPPEALASLSLSPNADQQTYCYPSSFKLDHLAQSTIALSALTVALVQSLKTGGAVPKVNVPLKHACLEFKTERLYTLDGMAPASGWGPIGGLHKVADGYVRIHDSFPNHRYGTLALLGLERNASREDVAEKVAWRKRFELEEVAARSKLVIYALRSYDEWDATPQAQALSDLPVRIRKLSDDGPAGLPPHMSGRTDRCLRGLRVLEFSRVIAAPVAGKTLAAHGTDVLWITSPKLPDLPALDRNLARGKRTIQLDLNDETDRDTLRSLVREADVFLQGYRPSSLAAKGFGPSELQAMRPGIIVANLSAFGPEGPWAERRGFDSLVQTCSGMNVSEAERFYSITNDGNSSKNDDGALPPLSPAKPLPCQALDHAAGYLLATGIAAAVYRRSREGGSWGVDVSLAGVGKFLRSLGQWEGRRGFEQATGLPDLEGLEGEGEGGLFEERMSGFGVLKALRHVAGVEGAEVGWEVMPQVLRSGDAKWL